MPIPKIIHAIWLGSILNKEGRENLENWKRKNSSHEVCLWIDSSLFASSTSTDIKESDIDLNYQDLINWGKKNKIIIADIARPKSESDETVHGRSDIYKNMLSQSFYNDEINGKYKNLAAASDILRLEILYHEGGMYIDAKDVFPSDQKLENIKAKFGFLFHQKKNGSVNNDILASVPKGTVISAYREATYKNYQDLYKDESRLNAHRNPDFTSPLLYSGENPRKQSTLVASGPGAMDAVIRDFEADGAIIPEAKVNITDESLLVFLDKYFKLPSIQASSWFDTKADQKLEKVIPILRNYVRVYFNNMIEDRIAQLKKISFIDRDAKETIETISLLNMLKEKLNALPPHLPMTNIYKSSVHELDEKAIFKLSNPPNNIIEPLKNCSESLEILINKLEKLDDPKSLSTMLNKIGVKIYSEYQLSDFVKDVLNTDDGQPNLGKLKKYGINIPTLTLKKER